MPIVNIPFKGPNRDTDDTSLNLNLKYIKNGYIDRLGNIKSIPGKRLFCDLGTSSRVDGIHESSQLNINTNKKFAYVVSGGRIFTLEDMKGNYREITGDKLQSYRRTTFTELYSGSDVYSFFANGGQIVYSKRGETTQFHPDVDAPQKCSHIAKFYTYLVFNKEDSSSFGFSNPNLPFTIDPTDEYDAEMSVSNIDALHVVNNQLILWSEKSIENWINAGTPGDPFLRRLNTYINDNGILARDCISIANLHGINIPVFIDKNLNVMALIGGTTKKLSDPYERYISEFQRISDARSFILQSPGLNLYIMTFPSENKTLAYDLNTNNWYELGNYKSLLEYDIYDGFCSEYIRDWNKYLIGGDNGKIYEISNDYYTNAGEPLGCSIETGHINHGNESELKFCEGLKARIKRGLGKSSDPTETPFFLYRHKDNNKNQWSNWKKISLGRRGDTNINVDIFRNRGGKYYTRKHQIVLPDDTELVISQLEEKIRMEK